ncbi:MAG: (d)CMP kinase [Rhodospirillaceae bacterium]|jgi:CMP/dCMP kinase|nr:(d)CMP kinase [Rhodospirillaceae bacterium]MBT4219004.1 (d)CMP kinase [Rhodospirillaceae bacterium]MBT4464320.1 (d)CMP kinase [Rhodospirillaceae bacterium]MBT5309241.1 (d)CMP kinase [Rhodospirillaceae bacterium]MBT5562631.1 (d)CMP kinase [Rhodospirillaceae bacterium]
MSNTPKLIAIDGPAAAGKGTLAKRLAAHFDLQLLDTGLLYRGVARKVLDAGVEVADNPEAYAKIAGETARGLVAADLEVDGLRTDETAQAASRVSAVPEVRAALLAFQRDFADTPPYDGKGAVLDGRDIGTVVCPDAPVKLFITASTEVRAKRRLKELQDRGVEAIYAGVLEDMQQRDARDQGRDASPLVPAEDSFLLDTSDLDADQAFTSALEFIASREPFG